jgi:LysM repeat protein
MGAGHGDRRPVKIRRTGRHTTPSQVEKVAEKAGRAAPAVAIAGALVAAPQLQHALHKPAVTAAQAATLTAFHRHSAPATLDSVTSLASTASVQTAAQHARPAATARNTRYTVRAGDTLSGIAERFYHNPNDWRWIYDENETTISNPNMIRVGEVLLIPAHAPGKHASEYKPRHAKSGTGGRHGAGASTTKLTSSHPGSDPGRKRPPKLGGTLGCSGLEELWDEAGGNPSDAFMAAEIAMAESGGHQYALSPTDDYGYWQINISNGALATFNALGNARSAVIISHDGTDWYPWTTYTSGAYIDRC